MKTELLNKIKDYSVSDSFTLLVSVIKTLKHLDVKNLNLFCFCYTTICLLLAVRVSEFRSFHETHYENYSTSKNAVIKLN